MAEASCANKNTEGEYNYSKLHQILKLLTLSPYMSLLNITTFPLAALN